jgi:trehalose synthase
MRLTDTADLWWKTAVVYSLDVETFMDYNDDGVGDFEGLAHRIDYLAELGVTCLWLMPFYPTPGRDDGYDIIDFYGVDSRLGHHGDLVEVIRTAKDRGMRVIADLVVNHTSDQHPWFKAARSSRTNPYRDFYVWRDEIPPNAPESVFPGEEDGVWFFDEKTEQYYLHNFYHHQPDLNLANPKVREEIAKVIGFWMELGLSGFRVDAVPFLEQDGDPGVDPHELLRSLRKYLNRRSGDAVLLGEVNLPFDEQYEHFGGDAADELTMQFDFIGMQNIYLSLARQDARPLIEALRERPVLPQEAQWANFVRNHDELTLDKLTEEERQEVFEAFAPDENMRAFDRGIVRRLPPMLDGDPRHVRMVYSLMFSLPGTPVIFYGEEIGMGENLDQPGRLSVRTPMQWNSAANGGFSRARARRLVAPVTPGGFGPAHINVAAQRNDDESLLHFFEMLIRTYRSSLEIGWGELTIIDHDVDCVLVHALTSSQGSMIAVHNFSPEPQTIEFGLPEGIGPKAELVELLRDGGLVADEKGRVSMPLEAYDYKWLRVHDGNDKRLT